MKKTVILSTNDESDYLNYLPYVQQAWNILGWNTLTFYLGNNKLESTDQNRIIPLDHINEYRDQTVVQCSRLFGGHFIEEGVIMTSDVDMMPLSNYWNPEYEHISCYGHDLTGYNQFPICYIAANAYNWKLLVPEKSIKNLLDKYPYPKSNNFYEWWFTDQLIITERLRAISIKPTLIDRGMSNGLAKFRIDRAIWDLTKKNEGRKIDAHMPRPFDIRETKELLELLINNTSYIERT